MFRRQTSSTDKFSETAIEERNSRRARHSRRAQRRDAADSAAMRARLDRMHRRLAEVAEVALPQPSSPAAIDNTAARRDPMTRPFPMAFGTASVPRDESGRPDPHDRPRARSHPSGVSVTTLSSI